MSSTHVSIQEFIWVVDVSMCVVWCDSKNVKKKKKNSDTEDKPLMLFVTLRMKIHFSHVICMLSVFFSTFLLCHTIGHRTIFICQLPIYICNGIFLSFFVFIMTGQWSRDRN